MKVNKIHDVSSFVKKIIIPLLIANYDYCFLLNLVKLQTSCQRHRQCIVHDHFISYHLISGIKAKWTWAQCDVCVLSSVSLCETYYYSGHHFFLLLPNKLYHCIILLFTVLFRKNLTISIIITTRAKQAAINMTTSLEALCRQIKWCR